MRDLHGVTMTEGAVASMLQRVGVKAAPLAESIKEQVIRGEVIRADETSARVLPVSNYYASTQAGVGIYPGKAY